METIYKYVIHGNEIEDTVKIELPLNHHFLSIEKNPNANDEIWVWAMVDPESENGYSDNIYLVGTGHPADRVFGKAFLGTVILPLPFGNLVLHAFCDPEASYVDQIMGGI